MNTKRDKRREILRGIADLAYYRGSIKRSFPGDKFVQALARLDELELDKEDIIKAIDDYANLPLLPEYQAEKIALAIIKAQKEKRGGV